MQLMTKEIEKRLSRYPLGSQESKDLNAKVIVKYFYPYGRSKWLITEGEKLENGDWQMFGYFHVLDLEWGWEWGYVWLSDLEAIQVPLFFGYGKIERDRYIGSRPKVRDLI